MAAPAAASVRPLTPAQIARYGPPKATPTRARPARPATPPSRTPPPRRVVVRFRPGTSSAERRRALRRVGATSGEALLVPRTRVVEIGRRAKPADVALALRADPAVEEATPDYAMAPAATPADPRFPLQWGLQNIGQLVKGVPGTPGADIGASSAWDLTTGASSVLVGIVDSGIDYHQPEFAGAIYRNPGEVPGNGVDDDGNGLVDDVQGWDFVNGDNDATDWSDHGTHVAGIVGARAGNGYGGSGVAPQVTLLPLRQSFEYNTVASETSALQYAGRAGARVVNASFGGVHPPIQVERDVLASFPNTLFVVAAGNDGNDNDTTPTYPCSYDLANVLCVAATDNRDGLASFSNFGRTSVDLGAPGVGIDSTAPGYLAFRQIFLAGQDLFGLGVWQRDGGAVRWGQQDGFADVSPFTFSDSPNAQYPNGQDTFARSPAFSLAGRSGCRLQFDLKLSTAPNDALIAYASTDGATFTSIGSWSGTTNGFEGQSAGLQAFSGQSQVFILLRFVSDLDGAVGDGALVDQIVVNCPQTPYVGAATEFQTKDGTSMATPHVTGAAALIVSRHPELSAPQVKQALLAGVDPVPSLAGKTVTGGRLDARRALEASDQIAAAPQQPVAPAPAAGPGQVPVAAPISVDAKGPPRDIGALGAPALSGSRISVPVSCRAPAAGTCAGTIVARARLSSKKKKRATSAKTVVAAQVRYKVRLGKTTTVRAKLRSSARKELRRRKRLSVTVSASVRDKRGRGESMKVSAKFKRGSKRIVATGGAAGDVLRGTRYADVLDGGEGNDSVDGQGGNDTLSGGKGEDLVLGGDGKDRISVRDGERDTVRCGRGKDVVSADAEDLVAKDCERVKRPKPPSGDGGGTGGGGGGGGADGNPVTPVTIPPELLSRFAQETLAVGASVYDNGLFNFGPITDPENAATVALLAYQVAGGTAPPMTAVNTVLDRIRAADPSMSRWRISGYRAFWQSYLERDWTVEHLTADGFGGWIETYFWQRFAARQNAINQRLQAIVGSDEAWNNAMQAWIKWDQQRLTKEQLSQAEYDAWFAKGEAERAIAAAGGG